MPAMCAQTQCFGHVLGASMSHTIADCILAIPLIFAFYLPEAIHSCIEDRARIHLQQKLLEVRHTESAPGALFLQLQAEEKKVGRMTPYLNCCFLVEC